MRYRATKRKFNLEQVEQVIRYSGERYYDTITGRNIAIGKIGRGLVMIPYESHNNTVTPVTIHATTRQQINSRIKSGRFTNER